MKLLSKSEWLEFPSPLMEPNALWGNMPYKIERLVNESGEIVWFGLAVNWKKEPNGPWTVLAINKDAKPLEKYLPDIVYTEDRTYWKECEQPIYETMYQELS